MGSRPSNEPEPSLTTEEIKTAPIGRRLETYHKFNSFYQVWVV
jgi:hypothetical protein